MAYDETTTLLHISFHLLHSFLLYTVQPPFSLTSLTYVNDLLLHLFLSSSYITCPILSLLCK